MPAHGSAIVVPKNTLIPAVLLTTINTKADFVGQAIFCKSIFPVSVANTIVIPEGSSIRGTITEVVRPGRAKGRAKLGLRFDEVILPNGVSRQMSATLAGFGSTGDERFNPKEGHIEGSRSKKDASGKVQETTQAGTDAGNIVGVTQNHPAEGLAIGAGAGAAAGVIWIIATRAPDIILPQGISLTLQLSESLNFNRDGLPPPQPEEPPPRSRYDDGPALPQHD